MLNAECRMPKMAKSEMSKCRIQKSSIRHSAFSAFAIFGLSHLAIFAIRHSAFGIRHFGEAAYRP
jgi:hypothetical protein